MANEVMVKLSAVAALAAISGTAMAQADVSVLPYSSGQSGEYAEMGLSSNIYGPGSYPDSIVYAPYVLDADRGGGTAPVTPLQNATGIMNFDGNPVGLIATGSTTTVNIPQGGTIVVTGTTDAASPTGNSTNIAINEGFITNSNRIGTLLEATGTLVWHESFSGNQNNQGIFHGLSLTNPATSTFVAPNLVFDITQEGVGNGTTGVNSPSDLFQGNPGAAFVPGGARGINPDIYVGVTLFNRDNPAVAASGLNVYQVPFSAGSSGAVDPVTPDFLWGQSAVTGSLLPPGIQNGAVRQTQPRLANIVNPQTGVTETYICFGVGFSGSNAMENPTMIDGGSVNVRYFVVEKIEAGTFTSGEAVILEADGSAGTNPGNLLGSMDFDVLNTNADQFFVDHVATGGGGSPFVNSVFDFNANGQISTLWVNDISPATYQVRLYNPIFDGTTGDIVGFEPEIVIAENGSDGIVSRVNAVGFDDMGMPFADELIPFSGTSVADDGRVAFVGATDVTQGGTPQLPEIDELQTTLYVWTPDGFGAPRTVSGVGSLTALVKGGKNADTFADSNPANGNFTLVPGTFPIDPVDRSDSFTAENLSETGGFLLVNYNDAPSNDPAFDNGGVLIDENGMPGMNELSTQGSLVVVLGNFELGMTGGNFCAGDVNGDGNTTTADITFVVSNLGASGMSVPTDQPPAVGGDANRDGNVSTADITFVVSNLGCTGGDTFSP